MKKGRDWKREVRRVNSSFHLSVLGHRICLPMWWPLMSLKVIAYHNRTYLFSCFWHSTVIKHIYQKQNRMETASSAEECQQDFMKSTDESHKLCEDLKQRYFALLETAIFHFSPSLSWVPASYGAQPSVRLCNALCTFLIWLFKPDDPPRTMPPTVSVPHLSLILQSFVFLILPETTHKAIGLPWGRAWPVGKKHAKFIDRKLLVCWFSRNDYSLLLAVCILFNL